MLRDRRSPTEQSWRQAQAVFCGALEVEAAEREAYVRQACGEHSELAEQVLELLKLDVGENRFLQAPPQGVLDLACEFVGDPLQPGVFLDGYRINRLIGLGGTGAVYEADDREGSRVAIKIVRRNALSSLMLERFHAERKILGRLRHSNIARLLSSGQTKDGRPYLVMEYVEGVPILQYCSEHKLDFHERIRLFLTVCSAVAYAHHQSTVHRDIKPANVLVDESGNAKLLDFGIAKLVSSGGGFAGTTLCGAMTLDYASPEQIRGETTSRATDLFSLGVLLFELTTEVHPFRRASAPFYETARAICEGDCPRPSRILRRAPGPTSTETTTLLRLPFTRATGRGLVAKGSSFA